MISVQSRADSQSFIARRRLNPRALKRTSRKKFPVGDAIQRASARHHQLYNPWLDHTDGPATADGAARTGARAGISTLRGAIHPDARIAEDVAAKVAEVLHGLRTLDVNVVDFNLHSPNLSDAFIALTGHTLRDQVL